MMMRTWEQNGITVIAPDSSVIQEHVPFFRVKLSQLLESGNMAKRVDGPIEWDAVNLKVKNSEAANRLIRTQYREGWAL